MRWVIVRVLPVPAPASTQTGPRGALAAARCSASRPSSRVGPVFVEDALTTLASSQRGPTGSTLPGRPYPVYMAGKQDKEASRQAKREKRAASKARRSQIFEAFKMQRREDKALIPWMLGSFLVVAGVVFGVGFIFDLQWVLLPLGIILGALLAMV